MFEIALYIVIVLCWLAGCYVLFAIPLCRANGQPTGSMPSVSIIIPARNEEANLPKLLASLAAQQFKPTEVIVVDDHSDDRTAEIARSYHATVVAAQPLPAGWVGKAWACYQGAQQATGDLFIFLDADTYLAEQGLQNMVATCLNTPAVMSLAPYHETRTWYEQFSAFFNIIMAGSMNAFTPLDKALKPTGLFGPCLIVRRDQYFAIDGHAAVKDKILEHFSMAQKFIEKKIPLACFGGKGSLSVRMYPDSLRDVVQGWSKAFAKGAGNTNGFALFLIIAWLSGAISVVINLAVGGGVFGSAFVWGNLLLYVAYAAQIYWMLYRIGKFKWYTALAYPLPLLFFLIVFSKSAFQSAFRQQVQWKDRKIGV